MVKVRFEEWSDQEIAQACSFTDLMSRLYERIQAKDGGGRYAFRKSVKSRDRFRKWQEALREEIIEALKTGDMPQSRGRIELVGRNRRSQWDKGTYTMGHFYIKS